MALLELIQKHIRQRDLVGISRPNCFAASYRNTNDRQLKALFNYVLQTGDAQRFRIDSMTAEYAPQEKEKLMTTFDRLRKREEGRNDGLILANAKKPCVLLRDAG